MLKDKMHAAMDEINREAAEREELVEAIAIALLTGKNLFILGDTGQAKSFVINQFRKRITGARQFERLLSKQADEEQLFGRIDLSTLIPGNADQEVLAQDADYQLCLQALIAVKGTADMDRMESLLRKLDLFHKADYVLHGSKPKLITAGKIPDSHIIFLDEIFKANDGILNSLLTAMNERRFTNEGNTIDIPVISFFAASNEIPNFNNAEEAVLKPLYDRLELKIVTQYVEKRDARFRVLKDKQAGNAGQLQNTITLDELYAMQKEVAAVVIPDSVNELMDDILCELRDKSVHVSDRKYFGYYPLAQAYAWLRGGKAVEASDLLILRHYLWTKPEERDVVKQLLERKCINPLQDKLADIIRMALETYTEFDGDTNAQTAKRIGKLRSEFLHLYESIVALRAKAQSPAETAQIDDAVAQIEDLSRKAHAAVNFTYTPLDELLTFQKIS